MTCKVDGPEGPGGPGTLLVISRAELCRALGRADGAKIHHVDYDMNTDTVRISFFGGSTDIWTRAYSEMHRVLWSREFDENGDPYEPGRWHPRR